MNVDHNPDDIGLISRDFDDPQARLLNFSERVSDKYLEATIGAGYVDKYLYELYYDVVFIRAILAGLGALPKKAKSSKDSFSKNVDTIVNLIIDKIVSGEITKET
jgi:hypothetical protein